MSLDISNIRHADLEKFVSIAAGHQRNRRTRENYFDGKIPNSALGSDLPGELEIFQAEFNFARILTDALLDRLVVEKIRCDSKPAQLAADLIWRRSGLGEQLHLGFQEALEHGLSVGVVGPDPAGKATITLHTSVGWHVEQHPVTREVLWAFQSWVNPGQRDRNATLYTPGLNLDFKKKDGTWVSLGDPRPTGMTRTAVVPIINRAKLGDVSGTTELNVVKRFMEMAARLITNLGVAAESLALPMRLLFNVNGAEAPEGREEMMNAYLSRIMVFSSDGSATQLPGADLRNFLESMSAVCRWVAASAALPLDYLGISSDNPASAEAITRGDARLVKKVHRKATMFGQAVVELMQLALELDGFTEVIAEVVWRSPEIPNLAGTVDAISKLRAVGPDGKPTISRRGALEMLGYSPERIAREEDAVNDEFLGIAA